MTVQDLLDKYQQFSKEEGIVKSLKKGENLHLKGLIGSSASFIASSLFKEAGKNFLFILTDKEEAAYFLNDLENLLGDSSVLFFPSSYKKPYQIEDVDNANILLRAEVLNRISKSEKELCIVTYPEALNEKVVTKKNLIQNTMEIRLNETISIDFIVDFLIEFDFERVDFVAEAGQFSVRGGIVDVFSFANENPYRIEFFGDEVDSIRTFDVSTQLSIQNMNRVTIIPNVQTRLLKESRGSFFEFIPKETVIWFKDVDFTLNYIEKEFSKAENEFKKLSPEIKHLKPEELFETKNQLADRLQNFQSVEFGSRFYYNSSFSYEFGFAPQPSFNKNFNLLTQNLKENVQSGLTNIIFSDSPKQMERIYAIFEDIDKTIKFSPVQVSLHEGFIDQKLKLACYTDHQIFDRYHRFRLKSSYSKSQAITLKELYNLQPGDYITHIDHGVGRYAGLEKIDVNGKIQEAIRLVYKDQDILYISIHSLHRIAKYTGKEGTEPSLNKLGTNAWANLKQKTKSKVKDIAKDLIALYAKRKAAKGFAFSPDTYLQTELEASFIYEDTPDQEKATRDVKKDMESPFPMDRLICGDVGFGKTEIAIRAAFKAVADNKQVAVLVPTTILALQHYNTFRERLKDFPCKIDYINRFKSAKQQTETLNKLSEGSIDIVIGTHRLLGKDVKFKDLGLMIIDEEQKFGVAAKEKLKGFKVNVDTLTLTATPIPRTLQFSMMGARDLSVINTPPPNRYPVTTELHMFGETVIRDAVSYEIQRGGQVFFVHNRISDIHEIAGMIQRLVPDAKVLVGHGQMDGDKLEDIMLQFIEGDADVLVATTIIEAGLDIPNANTIIINHAHMFGLSDLHQMRGRVGRSNKKAFCYLLSIAPTLLTPVARKRLQTIAEFSELGSGFNVAMRDLDIRGAGNLLGGEQSGFINEIGFDMYQKILDEAMQELKETDYKELFAEAEKEKKQSNPFSSHSFVKDCQIDTDLEILIPDDYVNSVSERLILYKDLDNIEEESRLQDFQQQLTDRFGPVPKPTLELFDTIRLRWLAKELGFEKLILKNNKLIGHFTVNQNSGFYESDIFTKVLQFVQKNPRNCKMKEDKNKLTLSFDSVKTVAEAIRIFENILQKEAITQ